MNFGEYLLKLLHRPFKLCEEIKRFVDVIGYLFDETKKVIFAVRRVWFIRTAPVEVLELFGDEYGMPRFFGENNESYRNRLLNVFDWYFWLGTNKGILRAVGFVVNVQCQIREYQIECWKLGKQRLGRNTHLFDPNFLYKFALRFERALTSEEEELVVKIVKLVKSAHTIFYMKYPTSEVQIYWRLGKSRLKVDTILSKGA